MTLATLITFAAEAEHNVQAQTFIFGAIAFVLFMCLGLVVFSYRNVANRHSAKAEAYAKSHAAQLQQTGHGHH